jgi:hypothetical protein
MSIVYLAAFNDGRVAGDSQGGSRSAGEARMAAKVKGGQY